MLAFDVSLNGKRLCVAGISTKEVLTTTIHYATRSEHLAMSVGGLDSTTDEHVNWIEQLKLEIGNEITIKIINTESVNKPEKRFRFDTPDWLKRREERVREMAKELGLSVVKARSESK